MTRKLTEEHKKKICEACKGKSKNINKIWITDGFNLKRIYESDLQEWLIKGYVKGKKLIDRPQKAWNKGLKASDDPRVAKMRRKAREV